MLRLEQAAVVLVISITQFALLSQRKEQDAAIFTRIILYKKQEMQRLRGGAAGSFLTLMELSMVLEGWDSLTKHADKTVSVG
jgi:hypothetical protein